MHVCVRYIIYECVCAYNCVCTNIQLWREEGCLFVCFSVDHTQQASHTFFHKERKEGKKMKKTLHFPFLLIIIIIILFFYYARKWEWKLLILAKHGLCLQVRSNAAMALTSAARGRVLSSQQFSEVWSALWQALENSEQQEDFSEFKHAATLKEQASVLCGYCR